MSNMSYCRFRNTLIDLEDCYDNINDNLEGDEEEARKQLIELCCDIALEFGEEVGRDITDGEV